MWVTQAIERFSKGMVSGDIECDPMISIGQIDLPFGQAFNLLLKTIDEDFHVRPNPWFLFVSCFIRENITEKASHPTSASVVCNNNAT